MKLIVGLGNPESRFDNTPHNIGFYLIDTLLQKHGYQLDKLAYNGIFSQANINGEEVIILKPLTYINDSGACIKSFVDYFKIHPSDVLVIYDDIEIPLRHIRFRKKGSSGGHNGIKDIINCLNTEEFSRIKIGMDRPPSDMETRAYVWSPFSEEKQRILSDITPEIIEVISFFIAQGADKTFQQFSKKTI